MIKFYWNPGPNPMKVALLLEEAGLEYRIVPVDIGKGEQFDAAITALNPNNKTPIIEDEGVVFDSNAILLYLAEKVGRFLGDTSSKGRGEMLSWLMFVATGVGPFSGQAVHFRLMAPEPKEYGVQRYTFEARRHYSILNNRLADRSWILGEHYSIVDIAVWGWARNLPYILGESAFDELPNVKRLLQTIDERPAAQRACALKDRYSFKTAMDEEFRRNMFRHTQQP